MTTLVKKPEIKPFKYQEECLSSIIEAEMNYLKYALVIMASGLGKTIVSAFYVKRRFERNSIARCLFLCHQNDALEQAQKRYQEILGDDVTYGFFNGNEKVHGARVVFASFQTMSGNLEKFDSDDFDIIVVDETHHVMAETYKPVLDYFTPEFILGITATPERGDEQDICEIYGQPVYVLTLPDAIARGLLCPVEYKLMTDEITLLSSIDTPQGRLSIGRLNRILFIPKRDEEIANIILEEMAKIENPRGMIFCSSVGHAERMAELIEGSVPIHSKVGNSEKRIRLELFRQGAFPAAVTIDMFNEALDVPEINLEVFLRTTDSPTVYFQQLGRGLRPHFSKEKVVVLDFVGNCERITTIYDLWKEVQQKKDKYREENETSGGWAMEPFVLNIDSSGFQEKIIPLFKLMDRIREGFYSTWQEASKAAIELGITSQIDYFAKYRKDFRLPSLPSNHYNDFPGWLDFLGKNKKEFYLTWQEASIAATKIGITDSVSYYDNYKKDPKLPKSPETHYKDFPNWYKFFGKENPPDKYLTWEEASAVIVKLGIRSFEEYKAQCKIDLKLPASPHSYYKDFPGADVFFDKTYKTWKEAGNAAVAISITSGEVYKKKYKADPKLVSSPDSFYSDFPGWVEFLGKKKPVKKYETWEEASAVAIKLGVKGSTDYRKKYKQDPKLPSDPLYTYKNFPGWEKFLSESKN